MTRDEIRLECLKLAHRHDRAPAEVMVVGKVYEEFILGTEKESKVEEAPKKSASKKVGNS